MAPDNQASAVSRHKAMIRAPSNHDIDTSNDMKDIGSPTKLDAERYRFWRSCLSAPEPLLLLTILGVIVGLCLGVILRPLNLSSSAMTMIAFPGSIMLRFLKMIVLPLVSLSMISGLCSLRENGNSHGIVKLARLTAVYYTLCLFIAICLGLVLVITIRPGERVNMEGSQDCGNSAEIIEIESQTKDQQSGASQALMQVLFLIVPDNIAKASVDMNVLGIITFSLMFGWAVSSLGARATPVIQTIHTLNEAVGKMVSAILWFSPVGVASLIASSVVGACDVGETAKTLGLWIFTVVLGLSIFGFILLPAALYLLTRRSPIVIIRAFSQSLALAIGTSSSAGALPIAMESAKTIGLSESIVSFFLPLGIAVNLSGTALYEAITAIWIAQAHNVSLGLSEILVVAITASLAAVGAPAIPSAGLVTMMVVLQAAGLSQYAGDLAIVMAADWFLDRLRTGVNLLGDVIGCVIVSDLAAGSNSQSSSTFVYSHIEMSQP